MSDLCSTLDEETDLVPLRGEANVSQEFRRGSIDCCGAMGRWFGVSCTESFGMVVAPGTSRQRSKDGSCRAENASDAKEAGCRMLKSANVWSSIKGAVNAAVETVAVDP